MGLKLSDCVYSFFLVYAGLLSGAGERRGGGVGNADILENS